MRDDDVRKVSFPHYSLPVTIRSPADCREWCMVSFLVCTFFLSVVDCLRGVWNGFAEAFFPLDAALLLTEATAEENNF